MTTAADAALNEAGALRLVLATIRTDEDTEQAMLTSQIVFNEINSVFDMEHVMGVLAALVAEEMTIADGARKAARSREEAHVPVGLRCARGTDGDD